MMKSNLSEETKKKLNLLHACVQEKDDKVFFASMLERDEEEDTARLRSSTPVSKGMTLMLLQVPSDWDGQPIPADTLKQDEATVTAHVLRSKARGDFQIRFLSACTESRLRRFRGEASTGVQATVSMVGEIATVQIKGSLSVGAAATIESQLRETRKQSDKIILDLSALDVVTSQGIGLLITLVREAEKSEGAALSILIRPDSALAEILEKREFAKKTPLHTSRDMAVASFYM